MNKHFVPYDIAKELKEIGFDEPCFKYYDQSKDICSALQLVKWNSESKVLIAAPLYDQVIDWLIEKYNLHVYTDQDTSSKWRYVISVDWNRKDVPIEDEFQGKWKHKERKLALNEGILKAIELIKQKK